MMTMSDLRELISTEEKEMIDRYILNYAVNKDRYIHEERRATVDKILKPWANAKSLYLRTFFQDKLTVEYDILFSTPEYDLVNKMENNQAIREFRKEFHEWSERYTHQLYMAAGNDDESYYIERGLYHLISFSTLVNNSYSYDKITIDTPDGHKIILSEGCKPVKMIGKLNAAFHISEKFEAFRVAISMILNIKNIKGKLCLSIHPMDYMTMSDNNCNWESCMSWMNWGSYRQGTVEMMNSPYVIVAYIRAKDDMRTYNDYWNNKKWRSLYIVHPDFFGNIKGYPYQASDIDKIVLEKLKEMSAAAGFQAHYGEIQKYDYNSSYPIVVKDDKEMSVSFRTGYMYNDFGTIDHYCCVREGLDTDYFELTYSGVSECMWCGNTDIDIESEDHLICPDCDETVHCDCCGGSFTEDELYHTSSGPVCEDCLRQYFEEDARHGEYWYREDLTSIYVLPDSFKEGIENNDIFIKFNASCAENLPTFFDCDYFIYSISGNQKDKIKEFEKATLVKDAHLNHYENEYGVHYFYIYQSDLLPRFKSYISNQCYDRGYDFEELWYYSDRVSYASDEAREKYKEPLLENY